MSTRSTINVQTTEGIKSIYCHWDGYSEHHMPILTESYNTQEKVEALISLGNLSSLHKSIDCPEGHSFSNPIKGYCVFYGRDRQEENQEYKIFKSIKEVHRQEYNYFFIDGKWSVEEGDNY